jgi:Clp amino terminal domain, pathogenicity island component
VLTHAQQEAEMATDTYIGAEHLPLGLLAAGTSVALRDGEEFLVEPDGMHPIPLLTSWGWVSCHAT